MTEKYKLSDAVLSPRQHEIRMNIRNAYLAESRDDLRFEAIVRGKQSRWFEAACLLELASED